MVPFTQERRPSIGAIDGPALLLQSHVDKQTHLGFLKIDVEGMEINVLRRARDTIHWFAPWCWVEYWKVSVDSIKASFDHADYRFYPMDRLNLLCASARMAMCRYPDRWVRDLRLGWRMGLLKEETDGLLATLDDPRQARQSRPRLLAVTVTKLQAAGAARCRGEGGRHGENPCTEEAGRNRRAQPEGDAAPHKTADMAPDSDAGPHDPC